MKLILAALLALLVTGCDSASDVLRNVADSVDSANDAPASVNESRQTGIEPADSHQVDHVRQDDGDLQSQFEMGLKYDTGIGVPKDAVEAAKWYRKAAEQGHARSMNAIGYCYKKGEGLEEDQAKASEWFAKALKVARPTAEKGDAQSQYVLGLMYYDGNGVSKNDAEAANWFRKSARQGFASGQHLLGHAYRIGIGVPKDAVEAAKWHRKAAEQGHAGAQWHLGHMYADGDGIPKDAVEAAKWYRKAEEQGLAVPPPPNQMSLIAFKAVNGSLLPKRGGVRYKSDNVAIINRQDKVPFNLNGRLNDFFQGDYYTPKKFWSISLEEPSTGKSIWGYVRKDSDKGKALFELLKDGETHPVQVELKYFASSPLFYDDVGGADYCTIY